MDPILKINNLYTSFYTDKEEIEVLKGVSIYLNQGETIGIIGDSGSGKSTLADSILNILPGNGQIKDGQIIFDNKDLTKLSEKELNKIRGNEISIVFQNPSATLNPVFTIGNQIIEHYKSHTKVSRKEAYTRSIEMLTLVQIPNPEKYLKKYPFECSGGEIQRISLAIALMCSPSVLIADEITSALDAITQREIIKLLKDLKSKLGMSIIFITHDLKAAAEICNRVYVIQKGSIVRSGLTKDVLCNF